MSKTLKVWQLADAKAFGLVDGESDYRIVPFTRIKEFRVVSAVQSKWEIQALLENEWQAFGQYDQRQAALNKVVNYASDVWK
ncbi:hypothetical protein [Cupriavidus nantongensis]|uniref:Uncharacterized protein n=1 Tax=Cupriavidus nantongensis TaxID=1796606 RepID=A0A142JKD6_9BURK|nr:hypothetical protein [Cupriavidus nantongensis]AMR78548.1 hypothetical protein A2G96_12805 [Cupriavidus nantongensis]